MSYILDALKKSERERQRGTVPNPLMVQDFSSRRQKKRSIWPYVIILALIVNAGLFLWWSGTKQVKDSANPVRSATDQVLQEPISPSVSSPQTEKKEDAQEKDMPSVKKEKQDKTEKMKPRTNSSFINAPEKSQTKESPLPNEQVPAASPKGESTDAISEVPIKNKIYSMNELPSSILQKLPPITISIALYSDDPLSRMARINGKTMLEGQYLAENLRLDEISQGSVVFSYHGFRFRVGLH